MARTPMVSRTFRTCEVTALVINLESRETTEQKLTLTGHFKDTLAVSKAIVKGKFFTDDNVKFVSVLDFENGQAKYAMSEVDFINHASQVN